MSKIAIAFMFFVAIAASTGTAWAGKAHFVYDARSGKVLAAENADVLNHPASLTKMMTLYMTFEAIRKGKISWNTPVTFSKHAAARPPTKLWVKAGNSITVRDVVNGLIVVSANDAAAAIAEKLAGSESAFAAQMTRRARQLGMSRTSFFNASGLPDKRQVTTARDMATLGLALMRDFPKEYQLFSMQSFSFNGKRLRGHNNLMYRYKGMDGIKTGYTNASGFNLVSAVRAGDRRIVGVVLGGTSAASRDRTMAGLIDRAIGKASSGDRLVASAGSGSAARERAETVSLEAQDAIEAPVPSAAPRYDDVTDLLRSADSAPVPVPAARYATAFAEPETMAAAAIAAQTALGGAKAASGNARGGWQIQIAAADSREAALDLLARAQSRGAAFLAGSEAYTEAVRSGGSTLYRARFVGFGSKDEARNACEGLSKLSYDCMMLPDQG